MRADELFDIMGNKTRRDILRLLSQKPCFMSELAEKLGIGQKAINDHVAILESAGLIEQNASPQSRGRPRKYVRISRIVAFNATLGPSMFRARLTPDLTQKQRQGVKSSFPELFEMSVKETAKTLEELRGIAFRSRADLERFETAVSLLRTRLMKINKKAAELISNLEISDTERFVLLELVTSGGNTSKIRTRSPTEFRRILMSLERKKLIHRDRQTGIYTLF